MVSHWPESATVVRPKHTMNRIVSQKSVFVRPRRGFIVPDNGEETVVVPSDVKGCILTFLERFHGISERTVYNDIHGFIRHQTPSRSCYARTFREALARPRRDPIGELRHCLQAQFIDIRSIGMRHAYHQRGVVYEDGKTSEYFITQIPMTSGPSISHHFELTAEEVVGLFTILIEEERPATRMAESYSRRGEAHLYQGASDLAVRDFDEALDRDAKMPEAYHGRGNAYKQLGIADRATADLEEALRLKPELAAALIDRGNMHREGGSLEEAIRDFDAAIAIMRTGVYDGPTRVGDGLFFRAVARCAREDWVKAKGDLEAARQEGVLVASSFRAIRDGRPGFEDLTMPSDVATMLHVPCSSM